MQILKSDFIKFLAKVTPAGINRDAYVTIALYLSTKNLALDEETADILGFEHAGVGHSFPAPMLSHADAVMAYKYYQVNTGLNSKAIETVAPQDLVGFALSANCFKAK